MTEQIPAGEARYNRSTNAMSFYISDDKSIVVEINYYYYHYYLLVLVNQASMHNALL